MIPVTRIYGISTIIAKKKGFIRLFAPSFTPKRYSGRFWPSCATIGQVSMRSSMKISPQHLTKFLTKFLGTDDHVQERAREHETSVIHSDISDTENEPRKKTIMKRKG